MKLNEQDEPCHVCGTTHTWYIAHRKYFCKDHYEEAKKAARRETLELNSWHTAEDKNRAKQFKKGN